MDIPLRPISITMKNRDLKKVLNRIKPKILDKYTIYRISENGEEYLVLALGKPRIVLAKKKKKDVLSGLVTMIKEAIIKHLDQDFIQVYWDGSYYRIKVIYSPFTLKISI